jgi:hypothetical protein
MTWVIPKGAVLFQGQPQPPGMFMVGGVPHIVSGPPKVRIGFPGPGFVMGGGPGIMMGGGMPVHGVMVRGGVPVPGVMVRGGVPVPGVMVRGGPGVMVQMAQPPPPPRFVVAAGPAPVVIGAPIARCRNGRGCPFRATGCRFRH